MGAKDIEILLGIPIHPKSTIFKEDLVRRPSDIKPGGLTPVTLLTSYRVSSNKHPRSTKRPRVSAKI